MDIFLLKKELYIKTNKDINIDDFDNLIRKIYSIIYTYKLVDIVIDIKNKKLEKKIVNSLKNNNFSFHIKKHFSWFNDIIH